MTLQRDDIVRAPADLDAIEHKVMSNGTNIANDVPQEVLEGMVARIELVTPDKANGWLERNLTNRRMQKNRVLRLAKAMRNGEWNLNGQSIAFDYNGNMVDGQHRLQAVVKSQMPIWSVVVYGVPPEGQETTDTGKVRTLTDMLYRRGYPRPDRLSSIAKWLWRYENGFMIRPPSPDQAMTIQQGLEVVETHPGLHQSLLVGEQVGRALGLGQGVFGMLHYVLTDVNSQEVDFFFERLKDGQGLIEGDPLYHLRQLISNLMRANSKATREKISGEYLAAVTIKTWNAYIRGDKVNSLMWRRGGSSPEAFPKPIAVPSF